jgi:hypothetical protein
MSVIIPRQPSLLVAGPDVRRAPALKHRNSLPAGN